jgi:hypothetical protein
VFNFPLRQCAVFVTLTVALAGFSAGDVAFGAQPCSETFAPELSNLQQALGDVMGAPIDCARTDTVGDTLQRTTTGLAMYRADDGIAIFTRGEQHWALSDRGLQTWTAGWHAGLYPPLTPVPDAAQADEPEQPLASVQPMTVVGLDPDLPAAVVVEDASGSTFAVQTVSDCPDLTATVGDHVFLRSDETGSDLILVRQQQTCAVATVLAASDD